MINICSIQSSKIPWIPLRLFWKPCSPASVRSLCGSHPNITSLLGQARIQQLGTHQRRSYSNSRSAAWGFQIWFNLIYIYNIYIYIIVHPFWPRLTRHWWTNHLPTQSGQVPSCAHNVTRLGRRGSVKSIWKLSCWMSSGGVFFGINAMLPRCHVIPVCHGTWPAGRPGSLPWNATCRDGSQIMWTCPSVFNGSQNISAMVKFDTVTEVPEACPPKR